MHRFDFSITTCLLCGKCLDVCPVFNGTYIEEFSPRAKAFLLNKLNEIPLDLVKVKDILGKCVGCGRCGSVCPQNIDLVSMLSQIRASNPTLKKWAYSKAVEHLPGISRLLLHSLDTLDIIPFFKKYEGVWRIFSDQKQLNILKVQIRKPIEKREKAVIFSGCIGRYLKDSWSIKAHKIARLYFEVCEDMDWACCGYPFFFAGQLDKAKGNFEKNYNLWKKLHMPKIIVFCATCYFALKKQSRLIPDESKRKRWLDSIILLSDLFVGLKEYIHIDLHIKEFVLHKPCHMSDLSFDRLRSFFNTLNIKFSLNTNCCGFGGCTRVENPELCDMLGKSIWDKVGRDSVIVSGCSGCVLQFALTNPMSRSYHWLDLIDFI